MTQREVDLPQLFSDVSRTISGITNIVGTGPSQDSPGASHSSGSTTNSGASAMVGSLFGNTCFKACGIEDIQYAARSAGDMLITMRFCVVASTVVFLLCLVILTGAVLFAICKKATSRRFPLPAFVRDVFPALSENAKEPHS